MGVEQGPVRLEPRQPAPARPDERLARGLGWFSVGLGLAEVLAPRRMARAIGAPVRPALFRVMGMREIASGVGILSRPRPAGWLWSRVAGDVLDLALLAGAAESPRAERRRIGVATGAVAGVTVLDVVASRRLTRKADEAGVAAGRGFHVVRSVTVNRPAEELYRFWRDFQNVPRFMRHLERVEAPGDGKRSHWVAKGPAGVPIAWDAETTEDVPNERIGWRSLSGSVVASAGSVRFQPAPGGRGTWVTVDVRWEPPGGALGAGIAKLFGRDPERTVAEDLHRFKALVETGELPSSEGPSGRRAAR